MSEWALVLTTLGLVIASLGGVFTLALSLGRMQQEVATLKANDDKREKELDGVKDRLARGETRFAVITQALKGMETTLGDIKQMLTAVTGLTHIPGTRPAIDDEEDEDS